MSKPPVVSGARAVSSVIGSVPSAARRKTCWPDSAGTAALRVLDPSTGDLLAETGAKVVNCPPRHHHLPEGEAAYRSKASFSAM